MARSWWGAFGCRAGLILGLIGCGPRAGSKAAVHDPSKELGPGESSAVGAPPTAEPGTAAPSSREPRDEVAPTPVERPRDPSTKAAAASQPSLTAPAGHRARERRSPSPASLAHPSPSPVRPAASYSGDEPCRRAVDSQSSIGEACRRGGVPEAKREMKRMLRQARAAGLRTDCDACHADTSDYGRLTGDAEKKLKDLLATIGQR